MADYIPAPDEEFNNFASVLFGPYVTTNAVALGVLPADITALTAALTAWDYSWTGLTNAKAAYNSAIEAKVTDRTALETVIRRIVGKIQENGAVTNAQREAAGIPVHKTTRTAVPIPTTTPAIQRIDTSTRGILRLFVVDATTPDSRAKPEGVTGAEIREQIGGTAPLDPEEMDFLAIETRFPYRADFDAADVGKTVYFAFRWMNRRGQLGPWSQIYNAVVPS